MFNEQNPNIKIDKVENGFIVSVYIPRNGNPEMGIMNQLMPMIEQMTNKITGDDWKNKMDNEIQDVLKTQPPKPFRQFVAKDWKEVLKIINAENF